MKPIPGYDNKYYATFDGMIWSEKRHKFLKPSINRKGYLIVHMPDGPKTVHRLVALTYIDNPLNLETVDHIDENKFNNSVENLRWMSRGNNKSRSWSKRVMCVETGETFKSQYATCKAKGIQPAHLSQVLNGKRERTLGLHFIYY